MKQTCRRHGPQTSGGPPRHGSPRRNHHRDNCGPHPEKGRGEPRGGSSGTHNADAPEGHGGKPAGSAGSRPHQSRPATPEQTGPWAGDPRAPHPPARGQQSQEGQARTLYSWIQGPLPPEGQSAPDPGAKPPSLWCGDRKTTPVPTAAEKTTSPDPDRMASSSSQNMLTVDSTRLD
ncbi:hypothetical protein M9458_041722, partial [Cirrhinus mrigala]